MIRRREPDRAPFRTPACPAAPCSFVVFILTVVAVVARARPLQALAGFGIVLPGMPARSVLIRNQDR